MNEISKRIRNKRIELKMTAAMLANDLNIPVSTYRDWEYGRAVRVEYLIPLSQILGMPLTELLSGEKPNSIDLQSQLVNLENELNKLKKMVMIYS